MTGPIKIFMYGETQEIELLDSISESLILNFR